MEMVDEDEFHFITYRRPIFEIVNLLGESGFHIVRMHELSPRHSKIENPEQELESKFPRLLVIKAVTK